MRRLSMWCAAAVLAGLASGAVGAERNVVMIVSDDHGQHTGAYGNEVIQTPNLDQLAKEGTLFNNAFCTTASCSASRSVILTGLHNHANGQYGHKHSYNKFSSFPHLKGLPVLMGKGGYRTARAGKYHVAPQKVYKFDQNFGDLGRQTVEQADRCADFIRDGDKPFFLYYATHDPHRGGGEMHKDGVRANQFGNLDGEKNREGIKTPEYPPSEVKVPPFLPDTPQARLELSQYYEAVTRVDQGVGRLIKHLKEAGVYDKTLILYLSDHGIAFEGGKTTLYEGGMKSPLIVRNPYKDKQGVVSDAMISWVDLTPTVLDFAGLYDREHHAVPRDLAVRQGRRGTNTNTREDGQRRRYTFHGRSFLPVMTEQDPARGWDQVFASHTFHELTMYYPMRVVRGERWKLIWNIAHELPYPHASDLWASSTWQAQLEQGPSARYGSWTVRRYNHRPQFELYDLKNDPWETNNLADEPEQQERLARMKQQIKDFQKRTGDPWLVKWQHE